MPSLPIRLPPASSATAGETFPLKTGEPQNVKTFRRGLVYNAYAKTINKAYVRLRPGILFQHPFGRVPITTSRQFWNVIAYIHQGEVMKWFGTR